MGATALRLCSLAALKAPVSKLILKILAATRLRLLPLVAPLVCTKKPSEITRGKYKAGKVNELVHSKNCSLTQGIVGEQKVVSRC